MNIVFALTAVCLLGQARAEPPTSLARLGVDASALASILKEGRARYNLPSLSATIVFDTTIIYKDAVGYADLSDSTTATPRTVYGVGSVTKPITATMLVKLSEEGVLRLDDPVSMYVPEYKLRSTYPGNTQTTLRQLATHQSGLPRSSPIDFLFDLSSYYRYVDGIELDEVPDLSSDAFLKSLSDLELEFPPNTPYGHYSNLGFQILGVALERASGETYAEFVANNIFRPLGMNKSSFNPTLYNNDELATGYVFTEVDANPRIALAERPGPAIFSGGLYSTAEDICRFLSLQFQDGKRGGTQIISGENIRMMHWTGMDWAFSWDATHPALEHGGGVAGFGAHIIIVPGLKIGVAVLTNKSDMFGKDVPSKEIAWKLLNLLKPRVTAQTQESDLAEKAPVTNYVGEYVLGDNIASIKISYQRDSLFFEILGYGLPRSAVAECSEGTLCFIGDDSRAFELKFDRVTNGVPERLSFAGYNFRRKPE